MQTDNTKPRANPGLVQELQFLFGHDVDELDSVRIAFIIKQLLDLIDHAVDIAPEAGAFDLFDESINLVDEVDHDEYFLLLKSQSGLGMNSQLLKLL